MDVIKTEAEDTLTRDSTVEEEEEKSLSEEGNLLDLRVSGIKTECDPTFEGTPVPYFYPIIKCEVEERSCDVDTIKVEPKQELTANKDEVMSERLIKVGKIQTCRYSLKEKLRFLERIQNGEDAACVAREIGVTASAISKWKKHQTRIAKLCSSTKDNKRQNLASPRVFKWDAELFTWFKQERDQGTPLSGPMIQEKAIDLNRLNGGDPGFVASIGWLSRWKRKFGIHQLVMSGDKLSCDRNAAEHYKSAFPNLVQTLDISAEQIYNCVETGLNYKILPSKTLAHKDETEASGCERNKHRVTLLACCNATATNKLPLMVIGKARNVNVQDLPVFYRSQPKAWMNSRLFSEWFHEQFVPSVLSFSAKRGLSPKALLLFDIGPSHSSESELVYGDIRVAFLPANVTGLIQPLDQGVLKDLKCKYRKKLTRHLMGNENNVSVLDKLKTVTLKDVILWIAESWEDVESDLITKSWRNILVNVESKNSKQTGPVANPESISHSVGLQALETALKYVQGQSNVTEDDVRVFKRWRDHAADSLRLST
ncbi:hypothetical protein ANN_27651 [Periplaneta americana]|uniref:HTH CENPB-type domain-containing protein n=1 Tax=Periplaneta americana TaxID=6978 RepID=A0ABQ8RWD6_PERAM|nr:hypothetical protein ANN_27651 [Periplaneta americana]